MTHTKRTYQAPVVRSFGALESLTQGNSTGNFIDATFPAGTPFGKLTFS